MSRDGNFRRFFDWAVCGYGRTTRAALFTAGWRCATDTRRGRLVARLLEVDIALRRAPQSFRWWLADRFSQWALRLRGQRVTVFGYYDAARGNRASELADRLRMQMVLMADPASEEVRDAFEMLAELESCMGGTWARSDTPPNSLGRAAADLDALQCQVQMIARTHLVADELRTVAAEIRSAYRTLAKIARLDRALAAKKEVRRE